MAVGGSSGTDTQLAAIGGVVQGLLVKALNRGQPLTGNGSGPSRVSSDGDNGKSLWREGEATKREVQGTVGIRYLPGTRQCYVAHTEWERTKRG